MLSSSNNILFYFLPTKRVNFALTGLAPEICLIMYVLQCIVVAKDKQ